MIVSMHEAKTHFSKLVKKANEGEEVIITNRGEPVATLQPIQKKKLERQPGFFKPRRSMCSQDQWDQMNDDMLNDFAQSGIIDKK